MGEDEREGASGASAETGGGTDSRRPESASGRRIRVVRIPPVGIRASDGRSLPPKVVPLRGSIDLMGVHLRREAGTYQWSTESAKISLSNAASQTVTVNGRGRLSDSAGAEVVSMVFTPAGGSALPAITAGITVIDVEFSPARTQSYGYDDMDNAERTLHHVSTKKNDTTTVHVEIRGGATAETLCFTSDDDAIATATVPDNAQSSFDLTIDGAATNKGETTIHARANNESGAVCRSIMVNTYRERSFTARLGKFHDSESAGTALSRPNFSAADTRTLINGSYKMAVATIDQLTDIHSTGGSTDVRYDLNNNGILDLEPGTTSEEERIIRNAFGGSGQKVIIIKDLAWMFFLDSDAESGDTTLALKNGYSSYMRFIHAGDHYRLGTGDNEETVTIQSISGTTVTLASALTNDHTTSDGLLYRLNGLSGNPVFVREGSLTEVQQQRVVGHELGHSLLDLRDLDAPPTIMHWTTASRTDTKIRYKELPMKHYSGDQAQWEHISR